MNGLMVRDWDFFLYGWWCDAGIMPKIRANTGQLGHSLLAIFDFLSVLRGLSVMMLPYHQNLHHATHSFCFKNSLDGYQKLLSTETRWHDLYDLSNFKLFDKIQLQIKHRRFVPLQICPFVLKFGDFRKSNKALSGSGGPADPWTPLRCTDRTCLPSLGRARWGRIFV